MRTLVRLLVLGLLLLVMAAPACRGDQSGAVEEPSPDLGGPALVMFYTDN